MTGGGSDGGSSSDPPRVVCCVGDVHGFLDKLLRLWANLELRVGSAAFRTALVIFLGDYCDRGPNTLGVIDFLVSLPARYPKQKHVFLCGNHDLAFAAFIGALPPPPDGSPFWNTWAEYAPNEEREGWFKGDGYQGMHLQGRRWGGEIRDRWNHKRGSEYMGSIYDAAPTFESYGVPHGSIGEDIEEHPLPPGWVSLRLKICIVIGFFPPSFDGSRVSDGGAGGAQEVPLQSGLDPRRGRLHSYLAIFAVYR